MNAVIFDMDGVVLDSEPIYRACWQRAAGELGYELTEELYERVMGRNNGDAEAIVAAMLGDRFPLPEFRSRWTRYWTDEVTSRGVPLKPGAKELLEFLEERGIPKAIATSTERDKAMLSLGDLHRRFEVMVTGDEIERGKPAPDIFLRAAEKLSIEPGRCWVIEDAEAGVRAAHAAGMKAVIVPDLCKPSPEIHALAQCVCRSLAEVQTLLTRSLSAR